MRGWGVRAFLLTTPTQNSNDVDLTFGGWGQGFKKCNVQATNLFTLCNLLLLMIEQTPAINAHVRTEIPHLAYHQTRKTSLGKVDIVEQLLYIFV